MIETIAPIIFPDEELFRRQTAVPVNLQGPDYLEKYDFSTFIYDAVQVVEDKKTVLICPKLFNFEYLTDQGHFSDSSGNVVKYRVVHYRRYDEIWLESPQTEFVFHIGGRKFPFFSSVRGNEPFRNKRSIVTISRNNDISWIIDWLTFYSKHHGLEP